MVKCVAYPYRPNIENMLLDCYKENNARIFCVTTDPDALMYLRLIYIRGERIHYERFAISLLHYGSLDEFVANRLVMHRVITMEELDNFIATLNDHQAKLPISPLTGNKAVFGFSRQQRENSHEETPPHSPLEYESPHH